MKYQKVHIGSLIKAEVKNCGMTFAEFARRIGIQRQNVDRKVFSQQGLDTEFLIEISEILDFDFFKYFQNKTTCDNICDNTCSTQPLYRVANPFKTYLFNC